MLVESCWPAQAPSTVVASPVTPTVNVQVGMPSIAGADDPDFAYGLSYHGAFWMILAGLLFAPVGIGIVVIIWAACARSKMNRVRKERASLRAFPVMPAKHAAAVPARKNYSA